MKKIKLWFSDFYEGFDPQNNIFYHKLGEYYNIELDSKSPDYLIFSCYGYQYLNYECIRIFYTGENLKPDFNLCDYAIGFDYITFGDRYLRFPNFALFEGQFEKLIIPNEITKTELASKEYFCNFIYSNSLADPRRDDFFRLLSEYKQVKSPGKHLNNISMDIGKRNADDWMFSKINFQSKCKFSIAFENSSSIGYTTEKIMHAFLANTIPIYWGNPEIHKDFNSEAFINCHDYKNFEAVISRIKEIDQNDSLFESIIKQPAFHGDTIPENFQLDTLLSFLKNILNQNLINARRRPQYGTIKNYEENIKAMLKIKNKFLPILKFFK